MDRIEFYKKAVNKFITAKNDTVLVCGGGNNDKYVFENLDFKNVTISNLDSRAQAKDFLPFKWSFQNAECLTYDDNSFDYVTIHAAIHHMSNPHKALTEMYRIAKKGVLAVESRDSFLMSIIEKLQLSQTYEHDAVYFNNCKYGGVNNTEIPNYVFRWTEREVEKTIQTYAPYYKHNIKYEYGTSDPAILSVEKNVTLKIFVITLLRPFHWLFLKIFTKQQNLFAFFINKPQTFSTLFPWLEYDKQKKKIIFNTSWGEKTYKKNE